MPWLFAIVKRLDSRKILENVEYFVPLLVDIDPKVLEKLKKKKERNIPIAGKPLHSKHPTSHMIINL